MDMGGNSAVEGVYQGERAVWLRAGQYEAALLPEIGGNLIAFRDVERGHRYLREPLPEEMEAFKANPAIHGIPVLFPPNRYEDGKLRWRGNVYQLPVNEASTNNHLHGYAHSSAWELVRYGADNGESFAEVKLTVDKGQKLYDYLPFRFTIRLRYALSALGLSQQVTLVNEGEDDMPVLLAFHTAINAPFVPDSTARDCKLKLTIGSRWELSERMLPTGRHQPLSPEEEAMKADGVYPFFAAMDNHYTAAPQNGRNRMELTDTRVGATLVYDVGTSWKQWMIWNNGAQEGFFCPEPQVNLVNAPNTDLPAEEIGLFSLAPGEIWEETSRLYVVEKA
jgi:aldose 1-epimerase